MEEINILFFSPGYKWGTLERQVLQDCCLARDKGADCHVYCSSNSALDIKSEGLKIHRVYHEGNVRMGPLSFRRMGQLEKLVVDNNIKIVHCYSITYLFFVVLALRRIPQVSIQITINRELMKNYRKPWHRLLINRVDMIYLPARELSENILSQLSFPRHKIQFLGLPIPDQKIKATNGVEEKELCIGTYFSPLESNYESLTPILNALRVIREQRPEIRISLKIFTDFELSNTFLAENMKTLIVLRGLEDAISVEKFDGLYPDLDGLDIWLEGNQHEEVQDFSVAAIERGIALVAIRKAVSLSLSHKYKGRIFTYQDGDSRELRYKILKFYDQGFSKLKKITLSELHPKDYGERLYSFYERQVVRRDKFIRRRSPSLKKPF